MEINILFKFLCDQNNFNIIIFLLKKFLNLKFAKKMRKLPKNVSLTTEYCSMNIKRNVMMKFLYIRKRKYKCSAKLTKN